MVDYAEQLCLAVDEIVTKRLSSIKFDSTIIATIVDDSEAKNYKYTCSSGNVQFIAYSSDTTLKVNDSVQVTIPNNDYSEQKVIVGKYMKEDAEKPYVFTSPFETLVDITHNLIENCTEFSASLLANDNWEMRQHNNLIDETLLWSKKFSVGLAGYNRLGLKGMFQSHIGALKAITGHYGYRLEILSDDNDVIENNNLFSEWMNIYTHLEKNDEIAFENTIANTPLEWVNRAGVILNGKPVIEFLREKITKKDIAFIFKMLCANGRITEVLLDSDSMYGNPYNFQMFVDQEKVFNVAELGSIYAMSLYFYEDAGSFLNEKNEPIPYASATGVAFPKNLTTINPYVCLGYDIKDFEVEDDKALLFTLNGMSYLLGDNIPKEKNQKTIGLRWLHRFENEEIKVIETLSQLEDCEIRWYRYYMGAPKADEYSGVYWKRIPASEDTSLPAYVLPNDPFTCILNPQINMATEQIKAVVICNKKGVTSNILTFQNQKEIASDITQGLISGLSIWCEDNTYGNYYIYGQNNNLLDESKENEVLFFSAKFADNSILSNPLLDITKIAPDLKEAKTIIWEFPINNTMITAHGVDYSKASAENSAGGATSAEQQADPNGKRFRKDSELFAGDDPKIVVKNNTIYIIRECNSDGSINCRQPYRIKKTYNATSILNTIKCTVVKDGLNYVATKELSFGLMGTNGTDATLVIDFDDGRTALIADRKIYKKDSDGNDTDEVLEFINDDLHLTARLYDCNHKEVDFNDANLKLQCTWSWYQSSGVNEGDDATKRFTTLTPQKEINKCIVSHDDEFEINNKGWAFQYFFIVQVTVSGFGNYDLVAYKPIPIKLNSQYRYLTGPTEIIYNTLGTVDYYKGPYELFWCPEKNGLNYIQDAVASQIGVEKKRKLSWAIYNVRQTGDIDDSKFVGTVTPQNPNSEDTDWFLHPSPLYVENVPCYGVYAFTTQENGATDEIVWMQPILVLQNRYPSSTLNKWDGTSIEINEDEGYIISPAIAAGKKNDDNTFSGVMLGDWGYPEPGTDNIFSKQTGVYGIHHGGLAYAFQEDGKAFIGKSGRGRIYFDGNEGAICSGAWQLPNREGMFLDLDDGIMLMENKGAYIPVDPSALDAQGIPVGYDYDPALKYSPTFYIKGGLYQQLPYDDKNTCSFNPNTAYYIYDYIKAPDTLTADTFKNDTYYLVRKTYSEAFGKKSDNIQYYESSFTPISPPTQEEVNKNQYRYFTRTDYAWEEESRESLADNTAIETVFSSTTEVEQDALSYTQYKETQTGNIASFVGKNGEEVTPGVDEGDEQETIEEIVKVVERVTRTRTVTYNLIYNVSNLEGQQCYYREYINAAPPILSDSSDETKIKPNRYFTLESSSASQAESYEPGIVYYRLGYNRVFFNSSPDEKTWNKSKEVDPILSAAHGDYYYEKLSNESGFYNSPYPKNEIPNSTQFYIRTEKHDRYITLSADEEEYPLSIGVTTSVFDRNFKVDWNGNAYINDGWFKGTIYAGAGNIGGWEILPNELVGARGTPSEIRLNSAEGSISGGILTSPSGEIKLRGYFTVLQGNGGYGGYIGALQSNFGTAIDAGSTGVGASMGISCIKATTNNAGMSFGTTSYVSVSADVSAIGHATSIVAALNGGDGLNMKVGSGITLKEATSGVLTMGSSLVCLKHYGTDSFLQFGSMTTLQSSNQMRITSSGQLVINTSDGALAINSGELVINANGKVTITGNGGTTLTAGGFLTIASDNLTTGESSTSIHSVFTITPNNLSCTLDADAQSGIYARFA